MSLIDRVKSALRARGRDEDDRRRSEVLDARGSEILDPIPLEPPLGYQKVPSMFDVMRKMIADRERELSQEGYETPEEADDFDVEDDYDPESPYEHNFDPPAEPSRLPDLELGTRHDPQPESPPAASGEPVQPPSDGPATPPPAPVRTQVPPPSPRRTTNL